MNPCLLLATLCVLPMAAYATPPPEPTVATAANKTARQLEQDVEIALQKGDATAYEQAAQTFYDHWNGIMASAYDPIMKFQAPPDPSVLTVREPIGREAAPPEAVIAQLLSWKKTQQAWLAFREAEDAVYDMLYPWGDYGTGGNGTGYLNRRKNSISPEGDKLLFQAIRIMERLQFSQAVSSLSSDQEGHDHPDPYLPGTKGELLADYLNASTPEDMSNMEMKAAIYLNTRNDRAQLAHYWQFYMDLAWVQATRQQHKAVQAAWEKYRACVLGEYEAHPFYLERITPLYQFSTESGMARQRSHDILQYMGVLSYPKVTTDYIPAPWPFENEPADYRTNTVSEATKP